MAVSSFKRSLFSSDPARYDSFLAGNAYYEPSQFFSIATVTASGSTTTLTFSSIPSTYKSLQIRGIGRSTDTSSPAQDNGIKITFNSDATANYTNHGLDGNGTNVTASGTIARNYVYAYKGLPNDLVAGTGFGSAIIDIIDYASTSKLKTTRIFSGSDINSGTANFGVALSSGLWNSTAAITSVTLTVGGSGNWISGSTFALYGVK